MGIDIHGWVEKNSDEEWFAVMNVERILVRNYDIFGCLFGVMNYASFVPIAQERGVPTNASV
jgi:hypothetical protein